MLAFIKYQLNRFGITQYRRMAVPVLFQHAIALWNSLIWRINNDRIWKLFFKSTEYLLKKQSRVMWLCPFSFLHVVVWATFPEVTIAAIYLYFLNVELVSITLWNLGFYGNTDNGDPCFYLPELIHHILSIHPSCAFPLTSFLFCIGAFELSNIFVPNLWVI